MRIVNVPASQHTLFFANFLFCVYQLNTTTTTSSYWLENVQCVCVFISFSIELKSLILLA